jgi:hypothetical protein
MSNERCAHCGHRKESHVGGIGRCFAETPLPDDPSRFELCIICEKFELESEGDDVELDG